MSGGVTAASREFVYGKFRDFYNSPSLVIPPPASLDQREFAFFLFKERIMLRHKGFARNNDLKSFLSETVPSDVYHSCAYYENPEFEMDKKGWLGADLVFDIDADHIPTSCNKIHDEWTCTKCGFTGNGIPPELCSKCGWQKFGTKTWPCEQCLNSAKNETVKLLDMLEKDFGFSDNEIHVFFSGHRGYHVHIENNAVKTLDAMARKEIVDYVSGIGLSILDRKGKSTPKGQNAPRSFHLHDFGWNKRLKTGMQDFLANATEEDFKSIGVTGNYGTIVKYKEKILERCVEGDLWDSVYGIKDGTWKKIAVHIKEVQSAKIDTVVTTDIHRLIRMNGTLHGKTGLKKVEFPVKNLEDFDPFNEAVAFKEGTAKVFVSDAPEFKLGGNMLGPYKKQTVELPTAAAILLICKGRAEVAEK